MKHRNKYWSCTKFAERIRGTAKPSSATADEWDKWHDEAKQAHPVRYWIAETLLDAVQDTLNWPTDKLYNLKYYVVNRWVDQSHALVAHPKHIKRGEWMDLDHRILYCLFDELVDFVEIEKAYSNYHWEEEKLKQLRWWQGGPWRTRTWRSAEAGINHLEWEMSLTDEEWLDEDKKHLAKPTKQAEAALEILELYRWWTTVYPNRPDPYDASGWSAYCDDKRARGIGLFNTDPDEDKWDKNAMLDKIRQMEKEYDEEEEQMLIRLIKLRGSLWS